MTAVKARTEHYYNVSVAGGVKTAAANATTTDGSTTTTSTTTDSSACGGSTSSSSSSSTGSSSSAGCILASGHSRWREGAVAKVWEKLPPEYNIRLHEHLALTTWYCPASGVLLSVDVHRRGERAPDDVIVDLAELERLTSGQPPI